MAETLAQLVRKKYPGAYDDLSDSDLEARIDAKYPGAYTDLPRSTGTRQDAPQAQPAGAGREDDAGILERGRRTVGMLSEGDVGGAARYMAQGAGQSLVGAGKGLVNTLGGLANMAVPGAPFERIPAENRAQEIGMGAEQALEFLTPGGPVKGLAGAAVQGAKAGTIAAAQGADPRLPAALGAAGPLTAKLGEYAAPGLRKLAEVQYGRALAATTKANKATSARIVPELLDRGVTGTLEGLAKRGAVEASPVGRKLNAAYGAATRAGKEVPTAPIIQRLGKLKAKYLVKNKAGETFSANPGAVARIEAVEELVNKFGDAAPPDQLWILRQQIDDIITSSGTGFADIKKGTAKWLQRNARTAIQKELNKVSPDIAKLNAQFSFWKGLEEVATATMQRKWGQSGVVELGIRTTLGGAAGALLGEDNRVWGPVGALLGAVTKHPLYRTVSAVEKANLAHAFSKGNAAGATSALTRILAGLSARGGSDQPAPQPTPTP